MSFRSLILLLSLLLISSCMKSHKEDYSLISEDLWLKLYSFSDEDVKLNISDYITVDLNYRRADDSLFFKGIRKFQLKGKMERGSIIPALLQLSEKDSASLKVNTHDFFQYTLNSEVPDFLLGQNLFYIDLKILEVQNQEEFSKEKKHFLEWLNEFYASESQKIEMYLNKENLDIEPTSSGLYFISLEKGNGREVRKGKRIWVNYQGRFLNGHFIDQASQEEALDFVYGNKMYLIDGLEEAVGMMTENERALVILPSNLAFGSFGSAGGIVPPYSTLIYEVKLTKIE